ncbi:hypothetical protein [Chitinimonas sp.]|uniref:hypothetical protein n=1 Tax=Chitinimonas sp. TaxID=1934313 RepID=UPI0035B4277A
MQLDRLQLELRPRTNSQALDLGMALLRANAGRSYAAWLALWLPLCTACGLFALWLGDGSWWPLLLPWWLRPLLERIVLLVLSRAVFGEQIGVWQALRTWPRELGGGAIRLLLFWRLFMPGRGLYQPIWQLERARGRFADERRRVLGRSGAGSAAYWFGIACAHFELVLQFGLFAAIGLFTASPDKMNPLWLFADMGKSPGMIYYVLSYLAFVLAAGIIAPVYTACCFALYLNRRAELEAWDIEIGLRRLAQQHGQRNRPANLAAALLALLIGLFAAAPQPVSAAEPCQPPDIIKERDKALSSTPPAHSAEQQAARAQLDQVFADEDLRGYRCKESWRPKNAKEKKPDEPKPKAERPDVALPDWLPILFKTIIIGSAIALLAWLLYRYRNQFGMVFNSQPLPKLTGEIAGLDIRPETLPDDVADAARQHWRQGQRREALALLYRATLSRLVHQHAVQIGRAATEQECLQTAEQAQQRGELGSSSVALTRTITALWLGAAYAHHWPLDPEFESACQQWRTEFGKVAA